MITSEIPLDPELISHLILLVALGGTFGKILEFECMGFLRVFVFVFAVNSAHSAQPAIGHRAALIVGGGIGNRAGRPLAALLAPPLHMPLYAVGVP